MARYVVLLSGGLDSTVNLFEAHRNGRVIRALTINYGQRAAQREVEAARYFCDELNIPQEIIEIPWLGRVTSTALVQSNQALPHLNNLDDMTEANASAKAVWVPNRNGVFLNIAASFAEGLGAQFVVPGFNAEEAATFPDNSQNFLNRTTEAFRLSTMSGVQALCFTTSFNKIEMMKRAVELGVNLDKVWSCYRGDVEKPCGECESCQRFTRARLAME